MLCSVELMQWSLSDVDSMWWSNEIKQHTCKIYQYWQAEHICRLRETSPRPEHKRERNPAGLVMAACSGATMNNTNASVEPAVLNHSSLWITGVTWHHHIVPTVTLHHYMTRWHFAQVRYPRKYLILLDLSKEGKYIRNQYHTFSYGTKKQQWRLNVLYWSWSVV